MNVLLFKGCGDTRPEATGHKISEYLYRQLTGQGYTVTLIDVAEAHIPFFELHVKEIPLAVERMCEAFLAADLQIWLTPLYHGGMTGAMKNCLDWLELTARREKPYLTDKIIGLICWADGGQAMQGVNAMDAVARALRAWVVPYTLPIVKSLLYADSHKQEFSTDHLHKFDRLLVLLGNARKSLTLTP